MVRTALLVTSAAEPFEERLRPRPDLVVLDVAALGAPAAASLLGRARKLAPSLPVLVRIAPLRAGGLDELAAAMPEAPDGIWLRDARGRQDGERLAAALAVAEAELGLEDGATRIVASVGSAAGALRIASLAEIGSRLAAISYDVAAISRELGLDLAPASPIAEPLRAIRAAIVLAAAAAGVPAIESEANGLPDRDTLAADALQARRDGFSGKVVDDAEQLAVLRRLAGQAEVGRWMENFVSGVATK